MSWSVSWTGAGTDFDPALVPAANGGLLASELLEGVRNAVSSINGPVQISGSGHNVIGPNGELLPGSGGTVQVFVAQPVPVAPPLSENAEAPPVPYVPQDAVPEAPTASDAPAAEPGPTPSPETPSAPEGSAQEAPTPSGDEPVAPAQSDEPTSPAAATGPDVPSEG